MSTIHVWMFACECHDSLMLRNILIMFARYLDKAGITNSFFFTFHFIQGWAFPSLWVLRQNLMHSLTLMPFLILLITGSSLIPFAMAEVIWSGKVWHLDHTTLVLNTCFSGLSISDMVFSSITFAGSFEKCWKLRSLESVFNTLWTQLVLMRWKPCLITIIA